MQGVVRHTVFGALGSFTDIHRGAIGDARGSSANALDSEFLGDYNNIAANNEFAVALWNDVRLASSCPAVDAYRQSLVDNTPLPKPAPGTECPATFGNSDIFSR
jgi:hypothetical protein